MANVDRVNGARPVKHLDGSPYNGAANLYYIPSSDGTATFIGDFVKSNGTGHTDGTPGCIQAAATDAALLGVVVGFPAQAGYTADSLIYRAASTGRYVLVADAPDLVFEIQEDSVGGALAITDVMRNADIVVAAGSTTTGTSGMEIDSSDIKDATAQLRLLGPVLRADNEIGTNCKWLVVINEHTFKTTTGVT